MWVQDNQPTAAPMSNEEREQLLRHLKTKWAAVNAEYQKLGFVMDIGGCQVVMVASCRAVNQWSMSSAAVCGFTSHSVADLWGRNNVAVV